MSPRSRIAKKINASKRRLNQLKLNTENLYVRVRGGFGEQALVKTLHGLGVVPGDAVMIHSGFTPSHGFEGDVQTLISAFQTAVGPEGTLVMMTMPFKGMSAYDWLAKGKVFKVKRSVSKVGIVTEVFRRSHGVIRSVHPTHPVAAWGRQAKEFTRRVTEPVLFGPDSPFGRLVDMGGKVLLYDVPFRRMTFEHYLEDRIQSHLPVPLYRSQLIDTEVIDHEDNRLTMPVYPLTDEINQVRVTRRLEKALKRAKILKSGRLSLATLMVADAKAMADEVDRLVKTGWRFHRDP